MNDVVLLNRQNIMVEKGHKKLGKVFFLVILLLSTFPVHSEIKVNWHGFGTLAAGVFDNDSISNTPTFQFDGYDDDIKYDVETRFGLQAMAVLDGKLGVTAQVISEGIDDFKPELEWAYLSYAYSDSINFRLGRAGA